MNSNKQVYHWDAPVKLLKVNPMANTKLTMVEIELLDSYGDGSGGPNLKMNVPINQLHCAAGVEEINRQLKLTGESMNVNDYNSKSLRELAELYNSLVPESKRIKKFSDKESAVKRLSKEFSDKKAPAPTPSKKEEKMQTEKQPTPQTIKLVGRKSKYSGMKIKVLVKENPRRENTEGWKNWSVYKDGMTYEDYILSKGGANHLGFDIEKGYVKMV